MSKSIIKALPELIKAGLISEETAQAIHTYYQQKSDAAPNRLVILFGILGAILTGLGIILIIAHNWDDLGRTAKTLFSFLPLVAGQALCAFTLVKKQREVGWRESTAAFLFFAVGASIALISQVYNIPGNLSSFLLTWMLLCVPLIYIMRASVVSLLYLMGITWYACEMGYWAYPSITPYLYWLLLLVVIPHYYWLWKQRPESNFTIFHHWIVPLSVIITLGTWAVFTEELMLIAYMSLFGMLYIIGKIDIFNDQKLINNCYQISGVVGILVLLLFLSFDEFWNSLYEEKLSLTHVISSPEFFVALVISLAAAGLLFIVHKGKSWKEMELMEIVFAVFIFTFLIGLSSPVLSVVIINLLLFILGITIIRQGARAQHLGLLNYGLLIITALIICRFFDVNMSFVMRGLLFVLVGVGFFLTNYLILQKKKALEEK